MAFEKNKEYKKLSQQRGWMIRKLWQGKDHLLLGENMGYAEDYKRFYFRDIQAFILRPSRAREIWGLAWLMVFLAFAFLCWALDEKKISSNMPLLTCLGLMLLFLWVNWWLGPGAVCYLKTAVQTTSLPISRRKKAEKIIRRLKPLLEAAQGELPNEPALTMPENPPLMDDSGKPLTVRPTPPKPLSPVAHGILFTLFFIGAMLEISRFLMPNFFLYLLLVINGFTEMILLVIALVQQARSEVSKNLRWAVRGALVFLIIGYTAGTIETFILQIEHPERAANQWELLHWAATQPVQDFTFSALVSVFNIGGAILFGIWGTLGLLDNRRQAAAPL